MDRGRPFRRALVSAIGCAVLAAGFAISAHAQCQLNSPSSKIKHVVYVEFDNVHFTRDNPNVPSDLEQIPNLLNFIKRNGTLDAGDHTVLVSHTANDILTTETGLYSDDDGIFVANSFGVFSSTASGEVGLFPSSFFYWTDRVSDILSTTGDNTFALTTPAGQNAPAPWVPFTRAGCDVGAFSTANIVLERTPFDVDKVFGLTSTQAAETTSTATKPNQTDDFIGAAIHCALGSAFCASKNSPVADLLPDEPGDYTGYQALFGLKYIAPALGGLTDYNGVPLTGFQALNFDPTPAQTLAVVETMLKKGIPVVYAYIADAHDNQEGKSLSAEGTFGPGEAPYVQQLADYNKAFGTFFANLKAAGIDQSNTLFIFTPDEGDHFVGGAPVPADCDGAKVDPNTGAVTPDIPCTYPASASGAPGVGELDINLGGLVAAAGDTTPFSIHFDDAATTYVAGQPGATNSSVRQLERTMAGLSAVNPHTGLTESLLGTGLGKDLQGAIVDPIAQKLVHMNTMADPNREPTFTFFGNPNFFFETSGSNSPVVGPGFAWNHGDIQPEIARTFIAIAGPGVKNLGVTLPPRYSFTDFDKWGRDDWGHDGWKHDDRDHNHDGDHDRDDPQRFFTDHVDLRPTMMFLLGLKDDYQHDGRVILELLDRDTLPDSLRENNDTLLQLGQAYKEINAPFGELSEKTLKVSNYAIQSDSTGDAVYTELENKIASWTTQRDALTSQIKPMLDAAEFSGKAINKHEAEQLIDEAQKLLDRASDCASNLAKCGK